ncbi:MAG: DNA-binding response regulator [Candidatus Lambdaproteobacteria bacterium RIFOXYD1_FULL_56_27]|uniref:DNA-binding response regulator n=1 Tax=Candidatus Lambdaproteobacteria bacterium RIFOXYD2_FULL_56_26 TaxID=1817773 RepID=A0A1F6H335_9PROT|nr:MAG: DNA-binding response regulator [Candidatus Lambdaproteobacteria bacterium RIFOXYC1_FULL_56_13]OGH04808.1 MAG: DNA-binding response regulator [Candidatus Lambdaproteobacteria bacterium RIFOXYD2_FULL_56_26]OGH09273.1 MAG: DNA-binding response regulator [Candidatus Lambdaproteobacteria bacterium RIFOXYD1_FULL_56_27]
MRILLVEDEQGVANFIKKGLEEERYTVDLVTDGQAGLEHGLTGQYDLLILDLMLPKKSGFEVAKGLRDTGIQTPILMLTAKISVQDKVKGLDVGADDYLTKPFSFEEFLARVRALLRRKQTEMIKLEVGDLEVNTLSHRVFLDGKELVLRPKEYAILEYLVRAKDCVVSRTQILENVWGYDFDPTTNVVDVHIKSIRKKLEELTPKEYISTVRGVGYMVTTTPK